MSKKVNSIIEILLNSKAITDEDARRAQRIGEEQGIKPINVLLGEKKITQRQILESVAKTYNTEYIELSETIISSDMAKKIPADMAKLYGIVPIRTRGETQLFVAVTLRHIGHLPLIDTIRQHTGFNIINFQLAEETQIAEAIKDLYRADEKLAEIARAENRVEASLSSVESIDVDEDILDESPVQEFVRLALEQAVSDGASDIIFESKEDGLLLRYRIDGVWYDKNHVPLSMSEEIISVIKILSRLDIAVRKRGQDGRMNIIYEGNKIDFRVNIFPIQDGENITMRIIDNSQAKLELEDLGFAPENLKRFKKSIEKPQGVILLTGPTGSGKSVTLYAGLNKVASEEVNSYTIEDPIEYRIDNVKQSQIDVKSGWTYPEAIRAFMRAAPDNILVGEIRDLETAQMALQAGMTGHLVLSTLHTNSSAEAAARLMDMGAEPDIVSMTLTSVVAQRLVRKLCVRCKVSYTPDEEELLQYGIHLKEGEEAPLWCKPHKGGCKECKGLGFRGRTAVHEVLVVDHHIRELIIKRSTAKQIEDAAIENGMTLMIEDSITKVNQGITTMAEVLRAVTTL